MVWDLSNDVKRFYIFRKSECNMYRRKLCFSKKLDTGERENTEGGVLNERLLLKGEECIFYGICS